MQCHAGEININVEGYVEVVGEDIPVSYTHLTLPTICSV